MEKILDFIKTNYLYFIIGAAVLVALAITLIVIALVKRAKKKLATNNVEEVEVQNENYEQNTGKENEESTLVEDDENATLEENESATLEENENDSNADEKEEVVEKEFNESTQDLATEASSSKTEEKKSENYHVVYDKENKEWCVKRGGAKRVIRRVSTKEEALKIAKQFASNQDVLLTVHKKDGKFQKKK